MSLGTRDAEAYATASRRMFAEGVFTDCVLVALDLEMQTRRLTLRLYGRHRTENKTYVASALFFGVADLVSGQGEEGGAFPQSARIEGMALTYDDAADVGHAHVAGTRGWSIDFDFDGIAFEETQATIASLADDDA